MSPTSLDGRFLNYKKGVQRLGSQKNIQCLLELGSQYFFKDFFFKNIYLFIYLFWLHWVLAVALGMFLRHAGSFVVACGIFSCSMHAGSSSPTRDRTWAPCIGSSEPYPLDHQGSPSHNIFSVKSQRVNIFSLESHTVNYSTLPL